MRNENAEGLPQTDRKWPQTTPQSNDFLQVGGEVTLYDGGHIYPLEDNDDYPFEEVILDTPGLRQKLAVIAKAVIIRIYHDPIWRMFSMDNVRTLSKVVWMSLTIVVPIVTLGLGVYVIGLGLYYVITWPLLPYVVIGVIIVLFLLLTVPQSLSNSRRRDIGPFVAPQLDKGNVTIINRVTPGRGDVTIINEVK